MRFVLLAVLTGVGLSVSPTSPDSVEKGAATRDQSSDSDSCVDHQNSGSVKFDVVMVATGKNRWHAIRYETATGRSWEMQHGAWVSMPETAPARQPGRYEVKAIKTHEGRIGAVKWNTRTGRSWYLNEGRWLPFGDELQIDNARE